jgi:hypothetical protein
MNNLCAAEIMDDFIPTGRQDGEMVVGVREKILSPLRLS